MEVFDVRPEAFTLTVVSPEAVVEAMLNLAKQSGWVFDAEEVSEALYTDPSWTWGDAEYTLIDGGVFVRAVFQALNDVAITNGKDYEIDYQFKYVALVG